MKTVRYMSKGLFTHIPQSIFTTLGQTWMTVYEICFKTVFYCDYLWLTILGKLHSRQTVFVFLSQISQLRLGNRNWSNIVSNLTWTYRMGPHTIPPFSSYFDASGLAPKSIPIIPIFINQCHHSPRDVAARQTKSLIYADCLSLRTMN